MGCPGRIIIAAGENPSAAVLQPAAAACIIIMKNDEPTPKEVPWSCWIVTGLSGAGKTRVINALEDIGFYCVDNIPWHCWAALPICATPRRPTTAAPPL